MRLLLVCSFAVLAAAQGTRDQAQRTIPAISAVTPRAFKGCGAPGAVSGNLPQDTYLDTCASPPANYFCASTSVCTTVASGNWQLEGSGGSSSPTGSPYTGNVVYASHISGVVLDCNLSTNFTGAGCTNNDTAINGLLATATAANPITLMMDGGTVTSGIVIPGTGHVAIRCTGWDAGFVIASGSNAHVIRNIAAQNGYTWNSVPGTPGQNDELSGCRINGNRGNGSNGDSNSGNPRQAANGNWLFGVYLENMSHVLIEHNWFYDEPSFNLVINSGNDVIIDSNRFDAVSQAVNQDGAHIDGLSSQIRFTRNWGNSSDDFLALNAPEGISGPITDVVVSDNHCVGCLALMLAYGGAYSGPNGNVIVSNVLVSNNTVSVATTNATGTCIILGFAFTSQGVTDVIRNIDINNTQCTTLDQDSVPILIADNVGTLNISNFDWISPQDSCPCGLTPGGARSLIDFYIQDQSAVTVSNIRITGGSIYRDTAGHPGVWLATIPNTVTVKRLEVDGFAVVNEQGQTYSALPYLIDVQSGGAIGTFVLDGIDPALSPTLLNGNEWSRIGSLYGPGVSSYWRNTTYANLPPATYPGLAVSISDGTSIVWGATEAGSGSDFAQLGSNGTNWTVTGK